MGWTWPTCYYFIELITNYMLGRRSPIETRRTPHFFCSLHACWTTVWICLWISFKVIAIISVDELLIFLEKKKSETITCLRWTKAIDRSILSCVNYNKQKRIDTLNVLADPILSHFFFPFSYYLRKFVFSRLIQIIVYVNPSALRMKNLKPKLDRLKHTTREAIKQERDGEEERN